MQWAAAFSQPQVLRKLVPFQASLVVSLSSSKLMKSSSNLCTKRKLNRGFPQMVVVSVASARLMTTMVFSTITLVRVILLRLLLLRTRNWLNKLISRWRRLKLRNRCRIWTAMWVITTNKANFEMQPSYLITLCCPWKTSASMLTVLLACSSRSLRKKASKKRMRKSRLIAKIETLAVQTVSCTCKTQIQSIYVWISRKDATISTLPKINFSATRYCHHRSPSIASRKCMKTNRSDTAFTALTRLMQTIN